MSRPQRHGLFSVLVFLILAFCAASTAAQTTQPLNFENNYFVTGDYVVAGWDHKQASNRPGFATGTIVFPDPKQPNAAGVPAGGDVVAAVLYWQTVEKSASSLAGQLAYFNGKPITAGIPVSNQPPTWSSGGCGGPSNGTTQVQTYRADVRADLPVVNGVIQPNGPFTVELADSNSNGNTAPFSLGATLVIVYRVISPDYPMNAIVFYDGGFAPNTTAQSMSQSIWGFYAPAAKNPVAKLTHIVGNGQLNKYENVYFNGNPLDTLYHIGSKLPNPPFPGVYNGSWDNPTWDVSAYVNQGPSAGHATTKVDAQSSNSGCVDWGAIVFSTTVDQSDNDGLLDVWKSNVDPATHTLTPGYCDAAVNAGVCTVGDNTDPGWIGLPGATLYKNGMDKDLFVQVDTMCTAVTTDNHGKTVCDTANGLSYGPPAAAVSMVENAYSLKNIHVHWDFKNAFVEPICHDSDLPNGQLCAYPDQPGVVAWKNGLIAVKNTPLDTNKYPTEASCEADSQCVRLFQSGRKDSYHYALFADRLGAPNWAFSGGTLVGMKWSGTSAAPTTVTFTTATAHKLSDPLVGNDRVTVGGATSNPALNGTYAAHVIDDTHFSIQVPVPMPSGVTSISYTASTDPNVAVRSGHAGQGSGMSDIGGDDSVISLGGWGALGQQVNPNAGTLHHELGHSLGLTHGGYFYNSYQFQKNYVPTIEPNCKPNFQSDMSYLFQVDLLDNGKTDGSRALDYSEQALDPLNETKAGAGVAFMGGAAFYPSTKWYALSAPNGVGTAATRHCDGSPITGGAAMYGVGGLNELISWIKNQDINYDGTFGANLSGYDDWGHIDLRQIGATGSSSSAAGFNLGNGGGFNLGNGGGFNLGNGGGFNLGNGGGYNLGNGGGFNLGNGGGFNLGNGGGEDEGEMNLDIANSYVRPPRFLNAVLGNTAGTQVNLTWVVPTFGMIDHYNVYRSANGGQFTIVSPQSAPFVTGLSFNDTTLGCTMYTYFVSSVFNDPSTGPRESVPSNSVTITTPCLFTGFGSPLTTAGPFSYSGVQSLGKSFAITWQLTDTAGNFASYLGLNTVLLKNAGPAPASGKCPVPSAATIVSTRTLYGGTGTNSSFVYDTKKNQFVYTFNPAGSAAGCYVVEVDVAAGVAPGSTPHPTTVQLK